MSERHPVSSAANVVQLPVRHTGPRRLTKRQLAAHLGRSTRWIELRVREGMPVQEATDRYGRRLYDLDRVEAWLADGRPHKSPRLDDRLAALEHTVATMQHELETLRAAV